MTEDYKMSRDDLYERLRENDIYPRKYYYPVTSDQACFKNKFRNENISVARDLANKVIALPLYEGLDDEKIDIITNLIHKV